MEIDQLQLIDIIQLLLVQQRDILHMKAHLLALERVVTGHLGEGCASNLDRETETLEHSHEFHGTRAVITAFEQLLNYLPTTNSKN